MRVHVACGYAATRNDQSGRLTLAVLLWSETYDITNYSGAPPVPFCVTTRRAPAPVPDYGPPVFEVSTEELPGWVAVGSAPDAVAGPRLRLWLGEPRTLLCHEGDRVAVAYG